MSDRRKNEEPVLQVSGLCVSYGKIAALKGISFEVYKGEIVSVLGANGAGKTTTLNAVTGVLPVKSGDILFKGSSIRGMPTYRITAKGVVHVPEGRRIFQGLSVAENLRVAAYLYERKDRNLFKDRQDYVLEMFPRLRERLGQTAGTLSGGEQQMLAIGRALITGGELLLLDEPSMGIAPNLVVEIFDTIRKIADAGQTILIVEQNAMMAMDVSSYCYVLETGTVAKEGIPDELRNDSTIAEAYLG